MGCGVMSIPNFYFIPDADYNGVPDGEPVVLLDGFGTHANSHTIANGFAWGPDGWLYGTHGITNWSLPGKPGTPKEKRRRFEGGVWRYHPVQHVWEPFAIGTTNPWGIDWNEYGHAFVCNCVNPHLFHIIQGAHYEPARQSADRAVCLRAHPDHRGPLTFHEHEDHPRGHRHAGGGRSRRRPRAQWHDDLSGRQLAG